LDSLVNYSITILDLYVSRVVVSCRSRNFSEITINVIELVFDGPHAQASNSLR